MNIDINYYEARLLYDVLEHFKRKLINDDGNNILSSDVTVFVVHKYEYNAIEKLLNELNKVLKGGD